MKKYNKKNENEKKNFVLYCLSYRKRTTRKPRSVELRQLAALEPPGPRLLDAIVLRRRRPPSVAVAPAPAAPAAAAVVRRVARHGRVPVPVPVGHHEVEPPRALDPQLPVAPSRVGSFDELDPRHGGPGPAVAAEVDERLLPPRGVSQGDGGGGGWSGGGRRGGGGGRGRGELGAELGDLGLCRICVVFEAERGVDVEVRRKRKR